MKRIFDLIFAIIGIIFFFPIILFASLIIFFQDGQSPFYIAKRIGKNNKILKLSRYW